MKNNFNTLTPVLKKKLAECKLLVLDFDGVLTDNKVYVNQDGIETVRCDRGDGLGLELLRKYTDVGIVIISKEKNPVVAARAKKLKIKCISGEDNKLAALKKEIKLKKVSPKQVCFIGNDLNDIKCLELIGLGIAVNDSHPEIISIADYKTTKKGGDGAVREVCKLLLFSKNKFMKVKK